MAPPERPAKYPWDTDAMAAVRRGLHQEVSYLAQTAPK
jgi:hypothetical protein